MNKKQSTSGHISLYDGHKEFVTSKKYKSIAERERVLEKWKKMYRLEDRIFYININPELKTEQW
jgi:hypothetical protein|tara:strand:+ start:1689 stop:1880 length:192 start_codon:yes stop_codon:yes gene_type:complete